MTASNDAPGPGPRSIPALLLARLGGPDADREIVFRKEGGRWVGETGAVALARVRAITLALALRGIRRGDRIAIVGETRPEWMACDLAILSAGAVNVGLYTTATAAQMAYVLGHSGARLLFYDRPEQRAKVEAVRAGLPDLGDIVSFAELEGLIREGEAAHARDPLAFERLVASVGPEDLATIIYTSGTTGPPKGAMLTHGNLVTVVRACSSLFPMGPDDMGVAFLPLAHSLQRVASYGALANGVRGAFAESIEKLPENWREIRPTIQASVPRIWEKAYARVQAMVASGSPVRRALFRWAHGVGASMAEYRKRGAERFAPRGLRLRHAIADRLVFSRVRAFFGGRVRFLTSGGAPIALEVIEFFHALGILILEGWGLTETAAPATLNTLDAYKFGTVGRAIPGTEVKVAEDGELLVRGPGVFKGYWRDDAATAGAFTPDGFFRTGDIGEIDAEGFVRITDRKKSLIVTSAGKKIPPANVEAALKGASTLISQAYVHGDRRSFLVALIALDPEEAARRPEAEREAEVARAVAAANDTLARYEQVKRWKVIPREFSQEDGLLTPTLKQKRKAIEERYRAEIEALYAGEGAEGGTARPTESELASR